jgi:hypothetical protein
LLLAYEEGDRRLVEIAQKRAVRRAHHQPSQIVEAADLLLGHRERCHGGAPYLVLVTGTEMMR